MGRKVPCWPRRVGKLSPLRLACLCALIVFSGQTDLSLAGESWSDRIATFPETDPLDWSDDIASRMIDCIDAFLLRQTDRIQEMREQAWQSALSSKEWPTEWLQAKRVRLAQILGLKETRSNPVRMSLLAPLGEDLAIAESASYRVYSVAWDVFPDLRAEGLLLSPKDGQPKACVVAIPDADVSPEALIGLEPGVPAESQSARRLAESGCLVLIPGLISRDIGRAHV